jgi:maleamate amidohydrolase
MSQTRDPDLGPYAYGNEALHTWYRERNFGGRVGFGSSPALLVIDVAQVWLDPHDKELGSFQEPMFEAILKIVDAVRTAGVPVFFTSMGYHENQHDASHTITAKWPATAMIVDTPGTSLDRRLERHDDEPLILKRRQSAFVDTPLASYLIGQRIDTTIVVGMSTSGCIRSTCESAFNYDFHVIVPEECVGDRCAPAHAANLFDIDNLFGDVMKLDDVLAYLTSVDHTSQTR